MLFLIEYLYLLHMSVSVHLDLGIFMYIFFEKINACVKCTKSINIKNELLLKLSLFAGAIKNILKHLPLPVNDQSILWYTCDINSASLQLTLSLPHFFLIVEK